MSKLSTSERNDLPTGVFALPGRRYPIHDRNHAMAALSDVAKFGTESEKVRVRSAVKRRYPDMGVQ